jgi:sugar lactone lactonase YvrE
VRDPRLHEGAGIIFDMDGNILVTNPNGNYPVMRFNALTGQKMDDFALLTAAGAMSYGPDGNLYVASVRHDDRILRFNGTTGAFIDSFITLPPHRSIYMSGYGPPDMLFGPDGDVYLTDQGNLSAPPGHSIMRFDGTTGAYEGEFVTPGSGGLLSPRGMAWGPDGNLYVASGYSAEVLRYDGAAGFFIDRFIPAGRGGLSFPWGLAFASTLEPILAGWTVYLDDNGNGRRDPRDHLDGDELVADRR